MQVSGHNSGNTSSGYNLYNNKSYQKGIDVSKRFNPVYTDFLLINGNLVKKDKHDEALPNDLKTNLKVNLKQASKLPKYAKEGLQGNTNANFFEFLQLGKIPYWIGGPALVWCFGAGGKNAIQTTKQKAAGVALYYTAAMASKALIDQPVKQLRGIDLNRKYKDIVALKTESKDGYSKKKTEYHNVYESIDFTRWDLLYNEDEKVADNPLRVNYKYADLAKKMGIKTQLNDPDSSVKPFVKKIIVMSRAWKSALMVPMAGLALGLSNYEGWRHFGEGLGSDLKHAMAPKKTGSIAKDSLLKTKALANVAKEHFAKPLKNSFVDLWKGKNIDGTVGKQFGKAAILGTAATILLANFNILNNTRPNKKKYIDFSKFTADATLNNTFKPKENTIDKDGSYTF